MVDLAAKVVFIAGGSTGLGKELAIALARRGCHVTIFARRKQQLEEAKIEILAARKQTEQEVRAISLDLTDGREIKTVFEAQPRLPDMLYCVAGGTANEIGFLADISPEQVARCMSNNYLTAALPAQAALKIWIADDQSFEAVDGLKQSPKIRNIVFVSSAAAFIGLPGYTAYSPTKCAVRGLADTLRAEVLRYSGAASQYFVHVAFPSNFVSPAFTNEQKNKPALTKRLEGTEASLSELSEKLHTAKQVADYILAAVDHRQFVICSELEARLLFGTMNGVSPRRGLGIMDTLIALAAVFFGPIVRRYEDYVCKKDSKCP